MLDRIKFPYFNMQQLNLDWLMERIAKSPEIIKLPALAGDDIPDIANMIDNKALEIPKGICFIECGLSDDPMDRRCACLIYKLDNDNMIVFAMGMSGNIAVNTLFKTGGAWS